VQDPGQIPARAPVSARLRAVLDEIPALTVVLRGPDHVVELANVRQRELTGAPSIEGARVADVLGDAAPAMERYLRELDRAYSQGETIHGWEAAARFPGQAGETYWDYVLVPLRDPGEPPAGVVVHAVEVTRLVEARRRAEGAEHRYRTLFDANVIGVTISGDRDLYEANDAFLAMIGRTREELEAGLSWIELTAPESAEADVRAIDNLRRTGKAAPYEKEYVRPDGSRVPVLISGSRLQEEPLLVLATSYDLTERRAAEREVARLLERERDARFAAELAGVRMGRLQEITAGLSATNSPEEIARVVVNQGLEDLSASAGLLTRGERDLQLVHAVGFGPPHLDQWRRFPATLPPAVLEAASAARPVDAHDGDIPGLATLVAVPLEVAGRVVGALALGFREPRELSPEDREFLVALARQAAAALDRAQLFENRAYVARKLQEGLLPERLADVPGLEAEVVYHSISGGGEVGGDFYDLFEAGPQRWVVAVGDVSGKGTEAAVVTGLARHTVRAIGRVYESPAAVLGFLNGALQGHGRAAAFCTVGCATLRPAPAGGFTVRASSGGHPCPLVVRAHGAVEEVPVLGTMLGVADGADLEDVELELLPGDALAVYTDGVTDARRPGGERFGTERLLGALRSAAGGSARELAEAVESAVREHAPGTPADDRAILVLRAL
jgi:PAS domain S-box-containing protein